MDNPLDKDPVAEPPQSSSDREYDISDRYVAFCDILGFLSRVTDDFENTIRIYDDFLSFLTRYGLLNEMETCIYSDSVLITYDRLDRVVSAVNSLWFVAQVYHFLIRGGIYFGRYWERKADRHLFVVSDALIKAVKIEQSVKYPMVCLDPEIEIPLEAWAIPFAHTLFVAPILHFRVHNIVNPFGKH